MMTFLPYNDWFMCANVLDWQYSHNRLNNQVNEGIVIAEYLLGIRTEWRHNPKVLPLWKGSEFELLQYVQAHLTVWADKSHNPSVERFVKLGNLYETLVEKEIEYHRPFWLDDEHLFSNHRSILLGKLPSWYEQFHWMEKPAVRKSDGSWGYYYPTKES